MTERIKEKKVLFSVQEIAIERIINWFSSPKTTNTTAVVAMPTGSGKTGVICCLPYYLGDAVTSKRLNIDLSKPILIIAPGKGDLRTTDREYCGIKREYFPC